VTIGENTTGLGGPVIVEDQHTSTDDDGGGRSFAIAVVNSPGFRFGGAIYLQHRANDPQARGIEIENSDGVRFEQGFEIVCSRPNADGFLNRVRASVGVYSGCFTYTDLNDQGVLLWSMSDSQEEGGNASECVLEFGAITGTTRLARFIGLSADNQVWVDPTKVQGWDPTLALVDDGLGGGNVLIDPRATARKVLSVNTAFSFSLKASASLTIEREGPDPLDEDALPPPYVYSDGDTVTFAGRTYTWRDVLSTGPAVPDEILIPSAAIVADYPLMTAAYGYLQLAFLNAAVLGEEYKTAGEGVIYSEGTDPHDLVESDWGGNQFNILALSSGTGPNAYTVSTVMTGDHASWSGATMSGGGSADYALLNQTVLVNPGAYQLPMARSSNIS